METKNSKLKTKNCRAGRRGSVYLIVLSVSMIVTVIGLASLFAVRVQRRSAQIARDSAEARLCAESAVELGLLFVTNDPNWRSTWSNGTWVSNKTLGNGSYSLEGIDPQDGDLADSELEPLVLTGTGIKGIARHKTQVMLIPVIEPLEALNTCLHTSGLLKVFGGDVITAVGAPISTNGMLDNDEIIDGDAHANSVDSMKTITGILTVPAAKKRMPDPNVISDYVSKATVIPFAGTIDKQVLTPLYNPWGSANPDGVYFIDTGGSDLIIKNSRIHGTLIVRLGNKTLTLDNAVFMQNYRSDYPVLIVDGLAKISIQSCDYALSESSNSTNYNFKKAPYEGQWDNDQTDEYPNEIRGLVHVTGKLDLEQTARLVGAVISQDETGCKGMNTIIHNPSLYASPPEGYTYVAGMKISPGSYKQVVE